MEIEKQKNIKGFTLIELLVVVLIIGILAAIALPQYKKVVFKSRVAAIKQTLAAVKNSEELYYLVNENYAINASVLDIGIPFEGAEDDPSIFFYGNFFIIDLIAGASNPSIDSYYCPNKTKPWYECATTHKDFIYRIWLDNSVKPGKTECMPYTVAGTNYCNILEQD